MCSSLFFSCLCRIPAGEYSPGFPLVVLCVPVKFLRFSRFSCSQGCVLTLIK